MSAKSPSIYEYVVIESADGSRSIDISAACATIQYFEDIYSPTITAKILVVNTGQSIVGKDDKKLQSLYNGLPIRGGERVCFKISGNSQSNPGLAFLKEDSGDYLYVSSITNVIRTSTKETFVLNLVSREALTNETSRVGKKFLGLEVSKHVETIVKDYLHTEKPLIADKTENSYSFIGNLKKPFTLLTWLASKSIPYSEGTPGTDATAGYCFFETRSGFNFKSIDSMISSKAVNEEPYFYTEVVEMQDGSEDSRIIKYSTSENQDLVGKLRKGTYCSHRISFDPLHLTFTQKNFTSDDYLGKARTTGERPILPGIEGSDKDIGDLPSRIVTAVLDIGTFNPEVSKEENDLSPMRTQAQAMMRYNIINTQTLSMMVPSNTNLEAGDMINCEFPYTTVKESGTGTDPLQSGLYMIRGLCHHFDPDGSYTSLELIKDTFGEQEKLS